MHKRIRSFHQLATSNKYSLLLISFGVLFFGQVFISQLVNWNVPILLLIQNIVVGAILFGDNKQLRPIVIPILILIIGLEFSQMLENWSIASSILKLLYIFYFLVIAVKVYSDIYRTKKMNVEVIAAVLCGFIVLGLIGSLSYLILEHHSPNSFSNLNVESQKFQDLQYFSFITILSIGYGDITPQNITAKMMSTFFGLIGHFYSVIVIGIVIGKYLKE